MTTRVRLITAETKQADEIVVRLLDYVPRINEIVVMGGNYYHVSHLEWLLDETANWDVELDLNLLGPRSRTSLSDPGDRQGP